MRLLKSLSAASIYFGVIAGFLFNLVRAASRFISTCISAWLTSSSKHCSLNFLVTLKCLNLSSVTLHGLSQHHLFLSWYACARIVLEVIFYWFSLVWLHIPYPLDRRVSYFHWFPGLASRSWHGLYSRGLAEISTRLFLFFWIHCQHLYDENVVPYHICQCPQVLLCCLCGDIALLPETTSNHLPTHCQAHPRAYHYTRGEDIRRQAWWSNFHHAYLLLMLLLTTWSVHLTITYIDWYGDRSAQSCTQTPAKSISRQFGRETWFTCDCYSLVQGLNRSW